jgi:hypothetical protein
MVMIFINSNWPTLSRTLKELSLGNQAECVCVCMHACMYLPLYDSSYLEISKSWLHVVASFNK